MGSAAAKSYGDLNGGDEVRRLDDGDERDGYRFGLAVSGREDADIGRWRSASAALGPPQAFCFEPGDRGAQRLLSGS
jgi:hypothetical protein